MVRINKPLISTAAAILLSACGVGAPQNRFPEADCERVNISRDGKTIVGVEDMAYDGGSNTLYLSAYDRRTGALGGLYRLDLDRASSGTDLNVAPIIDGIRPHGINLTSKNNNLSGEPNVYLSFIDRQGDKDAHRPIIRSLSWMDAAPHNINEHLEVIGAEICAANDLARSQFPNGQSAIFITQDHKSCTQKAQSRENIFSPNKASVIEFNGESRAFKSVLTGLSFANGIAVSEDNRLLYVAETRKKRLTLFSRQTGQKTSLPLAGGPDNLTRDGDDIYAALIPNLLQFLRFRKGKDKHAPSRFAIISTPPSAQKSDISAYEIKHYDVPASVISGVTVAIKAGEHIWLGAAFDTAIARCALPSEKL